ncbi:MAG: rhamnulokinase family protein [Oscillospiraceae bacterium]
MRRNTHCLDTHPPLFSPQVNERQAFKIANTKYMVGLDCGNSSFRILLGKYDGNTIETEVIDQLPNDMIRVGDFYYWDLLRMFDGFKTSLKKIARRVEKIDSIGICTWGVDFALFDKSGNMISNALSYRNDIGEKYLDRLTEEQKNQMFKKTGILCDKINSVYLLRAVKDNFSEIFSITNKILMVPDILNYFMTGKMVNEPSELSTTQLMNSSTRDICIEACEFMDIPKSLFCKIGEHGKIIGNVKESILKEIGVDYDIPVVCVPSHDTASAIAAIPTTEDDFIFISSGTWSLIGTELDEPIINNDVLNASLTNEVGAFNKITLLKNSAGMFIIQRLKKEYDQSTMRENSWEDINNLANSHKGDIPLFNINNTRFFNPLNMSEEIWSYLEETHQVTGDFNWGTIIKAVHESMASCYAITIENIEQILNKKLESIYIVGGGSKNIAINELTAKRTGKKVIACSKESTALGNIATQICAFDRKMNLKKIREVIANSSSLKEYSSTQEGLEIIERYKKMP